MSIAQFEGLYMPICDICGTELYVKFDFNEAVESKKRAGWKECWTNGRFKDICPDCQDKHTKITANE